MPKRKKPTVEEVRSIKAQAEEQIFLLLMEFEDITGLRVDEIVIRRHRPAGFLVTPTIDIEIKTDL